MDKLESLEKEIDRLVAYTDWLKTEKIQKLEAEKSQLEAECDRLGEHNKYMEEECRKDKKSLREIKGNLQQLKTARGRLSGLLEKWNNCPAGTA